MVNVSPAQVHWFRLRRSGLVQPFSTPEETARKLIGVQAQLLSAADLAFWNRTANCTPNVLTDARLDRRTLVRLWGQRSTLHIYNADDWPLLYAAFEQRQIIARTRMEKAGVLGEFRKVVRRTAKQLEAGKALTYNDIQSKRLREGMKIGQMTDSQAQRSTAYIIFMQLVREGVACHGAESGGESVFVHRKYWLPNLEWAPLDPQDALVELACRYLTAYGPAEPRDLAHWYGTTVTNATRWINSAGDRCCHVTVGDRTLWCCRADLEELAIKPPPASQWPVRLLYRFDPLVLATKDKWWLIDEAHYKEVWRASAHVEAVLLVRGRIAGTWRYDRTSKLLRVQISPFATLTRTVKQAAHKQAAGIGRFLGLQLAGVEIKSP